VASKAAFNENQVALYPLVRSQDTDKLRSMARASTLIVCLCLLGALASAYAVGTRDRCAC